jgi:lysozyme family protein
MTASNWQASLAVTLDFEGGNDDDPRDPGGRTSRGILQREWNTYVRAHSSSGLPSDVWKAPQFAIVDIYRTQYWNPMAGDQWPAGVDLCVFDGGVNSGSGRELRWARSALAQGSGTFSVLAAMATAASDKVAIIKRHQAKRLGFLEALGTWRTFGRGWAHRVAGIESIATKMALQAGGAPPEIVSTQLAGMSADATTTSRTAAGGAITAPTAVTAAQVNVPHTDWTVWVIDGALLIITIVVVAYLLHRWYINQARSAAFAKVATK